jgi:hypothetical protein
MGIDQEPFSSRPPIASKFSRMVGPRVTFTAEPAGLEGLWFDLMNLPNRAPRGLVYLAAFAVRQSW